MTSYQRTGGGLLVPRGLSFVRNHPLGRIDIPSAAPPELQSLQWAPTNENEADDWAVDQARAWASDDMQRRLAVVNDRSHAELALGSDYELRPPMTEEQSVAWVGDYTMRNGFPTNPEQGAQMTRDFLDAQGQHMGVHPVFVASAELLINFPDDEQAALEWTFYASVTFAQAYGIPLTTDVDAKSLTLCSAGAALTQAGVPYAGGIIVTADALWDGTISEDEMYAMIGTAGAIVGAAVGQMFGIPAPIGAIVGQFVTSLVMSWIGPALGLGPSNYEKRLEAMRQAEKARQAMMAHCKEAAVGAWSEYQKFWYATTNALQGALNQQQEWLALGGLRHFGNINLERIDTGDKGCHVALNAVQSMFGRFAQASPDLCTVPLHEPIHKSCATLVGCPYTTASVWSRGGIKTPEGVAVMDAMPVLTQHYATSGARIGGNVDARAALSFYGAVEYVTPYHAELASLGEPSDRVVDLPGITRNYVTGELSPNWGSILHTDIQYIDQLSYIRRTNHPSDLTECGVIAWSTFLMGSLVQMGPAAALVQRDMGASVAAITAEAAAQRRDLIRLRRQLIRQNRVFNGSILAGGAGALLGWGVSSLAKR